MSGSTNHPKATNKDSAKKSVGKSRPSYAYDVLIAPSFMAITTKDQVGLGHTILRGRGDANKT